MESQLAKKYYSLIGIKREEDGKRYESFIGWSFCRKLNCDKYLQGVKYSLKEEMCALNLILSNQKIDLKEKDKIIEEINEYKSSLSDLKSSCTSSENNNDSKLDINSKTSSSDYKFKEDNSDNNNINDSNKNDNNMDNSINNNNVNGDININKINNNINNNSNINTNTIINNDININNIINNDINTNNIINNDININNIINNDINNNKIINDDINNNNNKVNNNKSMIYINKNKQKKNKKIKNDKIKANKGDDVHGDIDVIIPNVRKEKFNDMLKNNFYYENNEGQCIILNKNILKKLPPYFHLFIEIGINVFDTHWPQKKKQIKKYVSLINIRNKINNEKIKNLYIEDFEKRFSLHFNSNKNNIAKSYVYMLISNSDYITFIHRFMDNKIFKGDNAKEYQDISSIDPNELICCGYVDFEKEINSKAYLLNQIEKQNKKIEMQTQELQKQNKTIEELLIAVRNLQNQNGGNKTGEKKEKNYIEKNSEDST